jgi:hypothetical protein
MLRHVFAAVNMHKTAEELLVAVFSYPATSELYREPAGSRTRAVEHGTLETVPDVGDGNQAMNMRRYSRVQKTWKVL